MHTHGLPSNRFPKVTMAQFRELTHADGSTIVVNLDEVRTMQQFTDTTTIFFDKDHAISVKETPDDILINGLRNA
jgi:ABC-type phosphate/phosphonate transport system ATPase subunit